MSNTEPNRIERRSGQRFAYQIPVVLRDRSHSRTGAGCTQDLSSRGALVLTDYPVSEGEFVELLLVMPSEITLAEDMNVCCHAHVVRREQAEGRKAAIALRIERYDFLHGDASIVHPQVAHEEHAVRS